MFWYIFVWCIEFCSVPFHGLAIAFSWDHRCALSDINNILTKMFIAVVDFSFAFIYEVRWSSDSPGAAPALWFHSVKGITTQQRGNMWIESFSADMLFSKLSWFRHYLVYKTTLYLMEVILVTYWNSRYYSPGPSTAILELFWAGCFFFLLVYNGISKEGTKND